MAQRIQHRAVTVAAGTPQSAPVETPLSFPPGVVTDIEIFVPDGNAGLMGWAIFSGKTQIIPESTDPFIVINNDTIKWPLEGYPNSGNWSVKAYNTDVYNHTFYVRFLINEIDLSAPYQPVVVPIAI